GRRLVALQCTGLGKQPRGLTRRPAAIEGNLTAARFTATSIKLSGVPVHDTARWRCQGRTDILGTDSSQTCMGVFLSSGCLVCCRFVVRSGKAVSRLVACDEVRGARGRGKGTEMLA